MLALSRDEHDIQTMTEKTGGQDTKKRKKKRP
jgi:hypothetical protein